MDDILLLVAIIIVVGLSFMMTSKKLPKNIAGKVALVTGGGNGLGREICIQLAEFGCNIAIADIDLKGAEMTVGMVENKIRAKAYKVDLTKKEEIVSLRNQVLQDFGTVDILVNNAGLISFNTIFNETEDFIEKMTKINLVSVIWMTRLFLADMIKSESGHIVTISSLAGIYHHPYGISYVATKFGVTGFMMGLKEFLRQRGLDKKINTTCVMPDVIATREDVINSVSKNYKILTAKESAKKIVDAMLRNEHEISLPEICRTPVRLFQSMPISWQNFVRDHLLNESKRFLVKNFDDNTLNTA